MNGNISSQINYTIIPLFILELNEISMDLVVLIPIHCMRNLLFNNTTATHCGWNQIKQIISNINVMMCNSQ